MTYDLLSIGAHPDDVEVGTGGVLIDQHKRGNKTGIVILTEGEMGTGGTVEIRSQEIKDAAAIMGTNVVKVFNWGDTKLTDNYNHRLELATLIRKCRPKILLTPYPHVGNGRRQSHPDHVAAGVITINAANLAALKKADIEGEPHIVTKLFHYFLPPKVLPTFVVDITPHYNQWIEALSAHKSQFLNPEKSRNYIDHLSAMARSYGLQARCQYAHGFYSEEPITIQNISSLSELQ